MTEKFYPGWDSNPTPLTFWVSALPFRPPRALFSHSSSVSLFVHMHWATTAAIYSLGEDLCRPHTVPLPDLARNS